MDVENIIERLITQRQLYLWNTIVKLYKVPNDLNSQVHKLISSGTLSEFCESIKPVKKTCILPPHIT